MHCIYYLIDRTRRDQKFCETGHHLKNCKHVKCSSAFKCLNNYCLPWKYICDGYWDCPQGYDEMECDSIKIPPGFYKCSNSSTFILLKSVCDGLIDCLTGEDEMNCDFPSMACPQTCTCIAYGVVCQNSLTLDIENIKTYPIIYLSISSSEIYATYFLTGQKMLKILRLPRNNLSQLCMHLEHNVSVRILDLSNNIAVFLQKYCLLNFPFLKVFMASGNIINHLQCIVFAGLEIVHLIDLSVNRLQNLKCCHFLGVKELKFLNISLNNIQNVDVSLFDKIAMNKVLTSSSYLCCLKIKHKSLQCTSQKTENDCIRILDSIFLKVFASIAAILGLFQNLFCIVLCFWKYPNISNPTKKSYTIVISANFTGNLCYCMTLLLLISADIYFESEYLNGDQKLHTSYFCLFISFLSTMSQIYVLSTINLMTVASLRVVKSPMKTKVLEILFIRKIISIATISSTLFSLIIVMIINTTSHLDQMCSVVGYARGELLITLFYRCNGFNVHCNFLS